MAAVLVILAFGAALAVWPLCYWVSAVVRPRFDRWLWHRLGGEGDPPDLD